MQNKEKNYSKQKKKKGKKKITYIKNKCETFSREISQGQRERKEREKLTIHPGETTSQEINSR